MKDYSIIDLYNSLGQQIQLIDNNAKSIVSIDLNNVKGVYLLRLINENGKQVTKRVIVK